VPGQPPQLVHLRYLAIVLRVADVLDIDPERTPAIVLRHRDVATGSRIFWLKDHALTVDMDAERIVAHARPPSAVIHKAVLDTVDQIDAELVLARAVQEESPFERSPLRHDLPHRWNVLAGVTRDIAEGGDYTYIDGRFQPNTARILELLAGTELYRSPLAAIKELLNNAFDAVVEQALRDQMRQRGGPEGGHEVVLKLLNLDSQTVLLCKDTGAGIDREIITKHLLTSGSGPRGDILKLQRDADRSHRKFTRAGRFGIGVLSYFMIADEISFRTLRDPLFATENAGWVFDIAGPSGFGELRRVSGLPQGTEVQLRLSGLGTSFSQIKQYVMDTVRRTPCLLRLTDQSGDETLLGPGWTLTVEELTRMWADPLLATSRSPNTPPKPGEWRPYWSLTSETRKRIESLAAEAAKRTRWVVHEADLPHSLGTYRIALATYSLDDGGSLVFLPTNQEPDLLVSPIDIGFGEIGFAHSTAFALSWYGMRTTCRIPESLSGRDAVFDAESIIRIGRKDLHSDAPDYPKYGVHIDVDWSSDEAGTIGASRSDVVLGSDAADILTHWLPGVVRDILLNELEALQGSPYENISWSLYPQDRPGAWSNWLGRLDSANMLTIRPIRFPALGSMRLRSELGDQELTYNGVQVDRPVALNIFHGSPSATSGAYSWEREEDTPDRIVVCGRRRAHQESRPRVVRLWDRTPASPHMSDSEFRFAEFAPEWTDLVGWTFNMFPPNLLIRGYTLLNQNNQLVGLLGPDSFSQVQASPAPCIDPREHYDTLLGNPRAAAEWILGCLDKSAQVLWTGLAESDPSFLPRLWTVAFGTRARGEDGRWKRVMLLVGMDEADPPAYLSVISPDGWQELDDVASATLLPMPSAQWQLLGAGVETTTEER
jgi:hypothetical protein